MKRIIVKKLVIIILFICISTSVGVSSILLRREAVVAQHKHSYYDKSLEQIWRLVQPSEIVLYVLNQSIAEGAPPVDMIAIMQIENPDQKTNAVNKNYIKKWDNKKKKYVKIVDSTDNGLFQLNSKHIEEFKQLFWYPYETEEFDVNNYKHNTRMAIRLYKSHLIKFGDDELAACAYNCGTGNVSRNTIPKKTLELYLPAFKRYKGKMLNE